MNNTEFFGLMAGIEALLIFVLVIFLLILIYKVPNSQRTRRNMKEELKKIKEQIENPE